MPQEQTTITLLTTAGLQAPVRSLTDSLLLSDGALLRAKNCTYMPKQQLSLWRPTFAEKQTLVESPGTETVIASCFDCGFLAFVTADDTTYRQYLYELSAISSGTATVSAVNSVSVTEGTEDASVAFGSGYAYFAVEEQSVVLVKLEDKSVWTGGSILYTEVGASSSLTLTPANDAVLNMTQMTVNAKAKLARAMLFFARSDPKLFGKAFLEVYVNGAYKTRSTNLVYFGSLPDTISAQPTGDTGFYPVDFELLDEVELASGDVVDLKLHVQDYTPSDGTNEIYVESGSEKHEFLATLTGTLLHLHLNGVHHPKGGFCTYGQGRVFVGQDDGEVFSADPLFPYYFDGYVSTGMKLTGLYNYQRELIAFSDNKCSSVTGVWPDALEDVTELPYGVNCQQGILYVEGSLFLGWGGILGVYKGQPIANPFLAESTMKSYLSYYKRLNLIVLSLVDEGVHLVLQVNGLLATTWVLDEVPDGEIITICGDYALATNGKFYEMQFDGEGNYEVDVLTKAANGGQNCEFDRVLVLSGCNGPGTLTALFCCDCVDVDNWTVGESQVPFSQWQYCSVDFGRTYQELKSDVPVVFGDGLLTPVDDAAAFYRHPINCYALKTTDTETAPSGWAIAFNLKLTTVAPKTIGTLLGGFAVSVTNQNSRIGFAI